MSKKNRVIDFQKVKKMKKNARRRTIICITSGITAIVLVVIVLIVYQILQVTDSSRDFWGNFASSTSQASMVSQENTSHIN